MPSKITISNNPHVYQRKKHFRRRQSHQPKLQKEEEQQINEQQIEQDVDDFYYRYNQELQRKENTVKKAQIALLKLASQENQEEEEMTNWSNQLAVPKEKINFLKQLGNYMEDCSLNNQKVFLDDMQQNAAPAAKPVKQINYNHRRQNRGISVDGSNKIFERNKYNSSPKKLDIYEKKVSINMLKHELLRMDQEAPFLKKSQRENSDLSQKYMLEDRNYHQQIIDPTKGQQQKKSLNQCNIASAYPYIINSEQIVISHQKQQRELQDKTIQIYDQSQRDTNTSTHYESRSRKRSSNLLCDSNPKQSSNSQFDNDSLDDFNDDKLENDQDSDSQRFTPLSFERKKSSMYNESSAKKNWHEREKYQSNINSNSNSTLFNLSKIKQIDNIMKMKPFLISMLQTSTMLNNKSDIQIQEKALMQKDEFEQSNDSCCGKTQNYSVQYYLKTNQSDDHRSTANNNKTISNFNLIDTDEHKNPTDRRKYIYSSDRKQANDRPKTSSIHYQHQREQSNDQKMNQQNKEKILNMINNTNQQSLIQNQFGGIIINHPLFKQQNIHHPHMQAKDSSKENNNDSDLFINKGVLQSKNKFKIMLTKNSNNQNTCNSTRNNEISSRSNERQIRYQSFVQNSSAITKSSARNNQDTSEDRAGLKNLLKNNRAVAIGKARNSVHSKNIGNNSLNNSCLNGNSHTINNGFIPKNNNFIDSYYHNQSLYNQQQFFTDRNNFVGYQVIQSDNKSNNYLK